MRVVRAIITHCHGCGWEGLHYDPPVSPYPDPLVHTVRWETRYFDGCYRCLWRNHLEPPLVTLVSWLSRRIGSWRRR